MKALILHGTDADHTQNWFPWLKAELEKINYDVWAPDLPDAHQPDPDKWTHYLLKSNWDFQNNLVVGHSAGAVEILDLLQNLPDGIQVNTAVLVAPFLGDLGWQSLINLKDRMFDYDKIRQSARRIIVLHSDNDPYCPREHAEKIAKSLGCALTIMHDMKHFSYSLKPGSTSGDPRFAQFPELLEIIKA